MRGKGFLYCHGVMRVGITPAHAGKSNVVRIVSVSLKDHPRTCGEKYLNNDLIYTRGRITPAHAGKRYIRYGEKKWT